MKFNRLNTIMAFLLLAIVAYFLFISFFPADCKQDQQCFNKKAAYCLPAKYLYENQGNVFEYRVIGSSMNQSCSILITLQQVSPITDQNTKILLEGKSMTCLFPKQQLQISPVQETSGILNYCTGPLKEATLELMIQKLYGTIAQNLGTIVSEVNKNQTINSITNPSAIIPSSNISISNGSLQ